MQEHEERWEEFTYNGIKFRTRYNGYQQLQRFIRQPTNRGDPCWSEVNRKFRITVLTYWRRQREEA